MERKYKPNKLSGKNMVHLFDMDVYGILREHVLRYLPAKALFRSLTVCRDWKLQISTPFFAHNQSVSCRSFSGIFVQSPGGPPFFISLDQMAYGVPDQELKFLPETVDVKASSNGLLCCIGRGLDKAYYVCNPVNRQWKKLPKPSIDHGSDPAIALVFEPSVLSFIAVFKVVCIFASTDIEGAYEFDIYSSDGDSWKVSSEMYFVNSSISIRKDKPWGNEFGRSMYFDGVVYWPMSCGKTLSFEMKTQKASQLPISGYSYNYRAYTSSYLGTMDGKLCTSFIQNQSVSVTVIHSRHTNTMSSHSSMANLKKQQVSRLNIEDVKLFENFMPQVLVTWDGVLVFRAGSKIYSHDMKTHETKALVQGNNSSIDGEYVVLPYVNSLVALV